ncbi:MAG: cytochrome c3 family protein [Anaerobacillus sp.]|uniref:cytochrome c3 family protein n=1 Tax=Anaerobacillus sp. TaxID=1872506 RepID=UPI003919BF15
MMKRMLTRVLTIFFICFFIENVAHAKPSSVEVWQEANKNNFNVHLKWEFQQGDRLFRTLNGDEWIEISIPKRENGFAVAKDTNNGNGFRPASIVYFEVRDANYQRELTKTKHNVRNAAVQETLKRVNVFIGTGGSTAENAHGNYVSNTNTCKSCHITHKAVGPKLNAASSVRALCATCHTAGLGGSRYAADWGGVVSRNGSLTASLAGPITTGTEKSGRFGTAAKANGPHGGKATSAHSYMDAHKAPGDSISGNRQMSCTSCHQGHINNNNYRLLKDINPNVVVEAYAVNVNGLEEKARYKSGMSSFCSQCHGDFHKGSSTGNVANNGIYVHPTDVNLLYKQGNKVERLTTMLPLENPFNLNNNNPNNSKSPQYENSTLTCITCHYGHGTAKVGTQKSNYGNGNSTMLKRTDNLGMCQECHQK